MPWAHLAQLVGITAHRACVQPPVAEEVPDHSEEATAAALSNGYDVPVKLPFK